MPGYIPLSESSTNSIGASLQKIHNSKWIDVIVSIAAVALAVIAGVYGSIPCAVVGGVLCVYEFGRLIMHARRKPEEKNVTDTSKSEETDAQAKAQAAQAEKEQAAKRAEAEQKALEQKATFNKKREAKKKELIGKKELGSSVQGVDKQSIGDPKNYTGKGQAKKLQKGDLVLTQVPSEDLDKDNRGFYFAKIVRMEKDEWGNPTKFFLEDKDGSIIEKEARHVYYVDQDQALDQPVLRDMEYENMRKDQALT